MIAHLLVFLYEDYSFLLKSLSIDKRKLLNNQLKIFNKKIIIKTDHCKKNSIKGSGNTKQTQRKECVEIDCKELSEKLC